MRAPLPSRLPEVIDQLLALLRAPEGPLADVQILDGPILDRTQIENDAISVAPGTADQPGAVSSFTREETPGLGRATYVERIEVAMVLKSYSGETDLKKRRDRAAEILGHVKTVVDDHQVRDSAWDQAQLGPEVLWFPQQSKAGCSVEVGFSLVFRTLL